MPSMLDEILPRFEFQERHQIWLSAEPDAAYAALKAVTPREIRLFAPLMRIRMLPRRLKGKPPEITPAPLLEQFAAQGFPVLAEQPGREIVLGGVGRFWTLSDDEAVRTVQTRADFVAFGQPGYAKAALSLTVSPEANGSRIHTETRIVGTDAQGTRRFRRYWTVIRLPSGAIRRSWLNAIRRRAQRDG